MTSMTHDGPQITGGVDTHGLTHHAAVIDPIGQHLADQELPATIRGYRDLLDWMRTHGTLVAVGVEGTGAYGAELARVLTAAGVTVIDVDRPDRKTRRPCPPGRSMPGSTRRGERGRCRTCWPTTGPPPRPARPHRPGRSGQGNSTVSTAKHSSSRNGRSGPIQAVTSHRPAPTLPGAAGQQTYRGASSGSSDFVAHGVEIVVDGSVILREAFDLLCHPVAFAFECRNHVRGDVRQMYRLRTVQAREDLLDDPRRQADIEQAPDLPHSIDNVVLVVPVPVREPFGLDQLLFLVVTEHPHRRVRALRKLPDPHPSPLASGLRCNRT